MSQNVVYVGIEVDDVHYHASALDRHMGEVLDFRCRPTLKGLAGLAFLVRCWLGPLFFPDPSEPGR